MNKEKGKKLVKKYFDVNNSFNDNVLSSILHSDILYKNSIDGKETIKISGIDKFVKFTSKQKNKLLLHKQTIKNIVWKDNSLCVEVEYETSSLVKDNISNSNLGKNNLKTQKLNGEIHFKFIDEKIVSIDDSRYY